MIQGIIDGEGSAAEIVEARGLAIVSDDGALIEAIDADAVEKLEAERRAVQPNWVP